MLLKENPIYDFSSYEDNIKWDLMANPKPLAVIMRASIQVAGTRTRYEDKTALPYTQESRSHGFKTGLYHVLSPNGIAEQAALFLGVWNKCSGADLAPIVDVEIDLNVSYKGTIGNAVWQGHVKTFLDLVSSGTGKTPMIYTNQNYWGFVMTKNLLLQLVPPTWTKDYPLWVAQYPINPDAASAPAKLPSGWTTWAMWQYSEAGRTNGFLANDLNTASDWYAEELGEVVTPPVEPPITPPNEIVWPDKLVAWEGNSSKEYLPKV